MSTAPIRRSTWVTEAAPDSGKTRVADVKSEELLRFIVWRDDGVLEAQLGHGGVREDWVAINIGLPAQPGCHDLEGCGIVLGRVEDERVGPARGAGRIEVAWSSSEAHGTG